jgi:hypothetical protein
VNQYGSIGDVSMTDNFLVPQVPVSGEDKEQKDMEVEIKKIEEPIADYYSKTFKHFVAGKNKI